jgi:hypothetical protein
LIGKTIINLSKISKEEEDIMEKGFEASPSVLQLADQISPKYELILNISTGDWNSDNSLAIITQKITYISVIPPVLDN